MSLLDALFMEPAPIYGQYVRRESPLGPWPQPGKPRGPEHMRAMRMRQVANPSPELIQALRDGISRGQAMKQFGIGSDTYYRLKRRI